MGVSSPRAAVSATTCLPDKHTSRGSPYPAETVRDLHGTDNAVALGPRPTYAAWDRPISKPSRKRSVSWMG